MVSLQELRAHNSTLSALSPGLVAIFVGGTSGIGFSTARELARNTASPHIYLLGRNQTEATRITSELQALNPQSRISFVKTDVSLLKGVDEACAEIAAKEKKVNLLFMTAGYLTLDGRDETSEGLDRKFALHYYARMRFVQRLAPLLTAAAQDPDPKANLSRVVSVLDPKIGRTTPLPDFDDLSLKKSFSLSRCATHASAMNNFALERFAQSLPATSFIHASPGVVQTGVGRELQWYARSLVKVAATIFKPWFVDLTESGERHLFAATAPRFGPKGMGTVMGSDDVVGSGSYHLIWDGEVLGESKVLKALREDGASEKIWKHTEEVFEKIEKEGRY